MGQSLSCRRDDAGLRMWDTGAEPRGDDEMRSCLLAYLPLGKASGSNCLYSLTVLDGGIWFERDTVQA